MTAPADTITTDQMARTDRHIRNLDREIDEKCTEQREIAGHALARIAQAVHPGTETVIVTMVGRDGIFGPVLCRAGRRIRKLS